MPQEKTPMEFETRYEWLRPGQLVARRNECPLIIVPVVGGALDRVPEDARASRSIFASIGGM